MASETIFTQRELAIETLSEKNEVIRIWDLDIIINSKRAYYIGQKSTVSHDFHIKLGILLLLLTVLDLFSLWSTTPTIIQS